MSSCSSHIISQFCFPDARTQRQLFSTSSTSTSATPNALSLESFDFSAYSKDGWCGTVALTAMQMYQVNRKVQEWDWHKKRRQRLLSKKKRRQVGNHDGEQHRHLLGGPYNVDVRFVDIKASDAEPNVSQEDIDACKSYKEGERLWFFVVLGVCCSMCSAAGSDLASSLLPLRLILLASTYASNAEH